MRGWKVPGCAILRAFSGVISNPGGRLLSLAAVPLVAPIRDADREKLRSRSRTTFSKL